RVAFAPELPPAEPFSEPGLPWPGAEWRPPGPPASRSQTEGSRTGGGRTNRPSALVAKATSGPPPPTDHRPSYSFRRKIARIAEIPTNRRFCQFCDHRRVPTWPSPGAFAAQRRPTPLVSSVGGRATDPARTRSRADGCIRSVVDKLLRHSSRTCRHSDSGNVEGASVGLPAALISPFFLGAGMQLLSNGSLGEPGESSDNEVDT